MTSQTNAQSMLDAARQYAEQGISIIPVLTPTTDKPLDQLDEKENDELGKAPANCPNFYRGSKDATTDLDKIQGAWGSPQGTTPRNIGIATGEKYNLVVVDVDDPGKWNELLDSHGYKVPPCPKVTTGKGFHLYFSYPRTRGISNSVNKSMGFDIRSNGGYVVAPPSNHLSGEVYRLENNESLVNCPELPNWVFDLLAEDKANKAAAKETAKTKLDFKALIPAANAPSPYGMQALENECQAIAAAPQGTRNDQFNKACFSIGGLVAGGVIESNLALNYLTQAAQQSGLPTEEIAKTLASGFKAGKDNPRVAPPRADCQPIDIIKLTEVKPALSALEQLSAYTMNGRSAEMRQRMQDEKYVLDRIAILGQWTTLYAAPNTGKTLLTIWMLIQQVKAGEIDGSKVYYVNADDHYKGAVEKLELFEPHKINVLIPNQNNFDTDKLTHLIGQLTKDDEAMGQVIILDTLKKFTDLMDKKAATEFGKLARSFVGAGGTIITLAHTNKNRSDEGKRIFGGTSDILDDCDCSYVIDGGGPDGHNKYRAIFENNKARGDVAQKVVFQYSKLDGCTYEQLLNSIVRLGKKDAREADKENQLHKDIRVDKTTVDAILDALGDAELLTKVILDHVTDETPIGRRPAKNALLKWTGEDYDQGHRWTVRRGDKNEKYYKKLANPLGGFLALIGGGEP